MTIETSTPDLVVGGRWCGAMRLDSSGNVRDVAVQVRTRRVREGRNFPVSSRSLNAEIATLAKLSVVSCARVTTRKVAIPVEPWLHEARSAPTLLEVRQVVDVLSGGSHRPLLCQCAQPDGSIGLWVVKPQIIESLGNRRCALDLLSELAGAEVCAWAGIHTPAIGLTRFANDIEPELYSGLQDTKRTEVAQIFKLNRGLLAFCSRYLLQAVDLVPEILGNRSGVSIVLNEGASLFAVDVYIRHDDREVENPNAVLWRDKLVAIDNGAAFVGLDRSGETGKSLAAQTVIHSRRFSRHVLHSSLLKNSARIDWTSVATRLKSTTDAQINEVAAMWPDELDYDHLTSKSGLKKNLVEFLKERRVVADVVIEAAAGLCRRAA